MDSSCDDLAAPARWLEDAERVDVALYAGDVVAGALLGTVVAQLTAHAVDRRTTRR